MNILAIDPGTRCGFALSIDGVLTSHGVWNLGDGRTEAEKLHRLGGYIRSVAPVALIAVENASYGAGARKGGRGPQWKQILWQTKLRARIEQIAHELGAVVKGYHISTIKKTAAGNGRATKAQVRAAILRVLGVETIDDNDADAVAILVTSQHPDCQGGPKPKKRKQKVLKHAKKRQAGTLFAK